MTEIMTETAEDRLTDLYPENKSAHQLVAEAINDYLTGLDWLKENYPEKSFLLSVVLYGGVVSTWKEPEDIDLLIVVDANSFSEKKDEIQTKINELRETDSKLAEKTQ